MKTIITVLAVVVLALSETAMPANVSLSGTLSGVDYNAIKDDGDGNHSYGMDRAAASTFFWSAGSTVSITGTVDVRGLASGSYLEIGLVDKQLADTALSDPTENEWWSGQMFNNSAFATFYAGTRNYARLSDNNTDISAPLYNPAGATPGVFDFTINIMSDGNMELVLHGSSTDTSTTYNYGVCNWSESRMSKVEWLGGELENGSYLLAQLWLDTGDTVNPVSATYDITGTSVPEPATMALLAIGGLLIGRKRK